MDNLTPRLEKILSMFEPCLCLADIGSDHGYLVSQAVIRGVALRGIAVEINRAPFIQTKKTISEKGLTDKIEVRFGDGVGCILPNEIDALCIAGMGGKSMISILTLGKEKLTTVEQLVLQPNLDTAEVRQFFLNNGFIIIDDELVEDSSYIYQVIKAKPSQTHCNYTPMELHYGRFNLIRKSPLLQKVLERDLSVYMKILHQLRIAEGPYVAARRTELHKRVKLLEEQLENRSEA
ncbi:MAG: class I SAM-dependent methyltransferase [bacterium]|nr:class I SAM-dependent methyltransferase [bacterium]